MQYPCCPCVSSRSSSQLKVKYQTIKYQTLCHVRSVSPTLIERFSLIVAQMFISTRGCAEPMLPFSRLKVKVTLKGQKLTQKIFLHFNTYLNISETRESICLKLNIYMKCHLPFCYTLHMTCLCNKYIFYILIVCFHSYPQQPTYKSG